MARHILSLDIPDTMNDCILRVEDTSVYTDTIPVTCATLQVVVPGFIKAATFTSATTPSVVNGFRFNLTACNLDLQTLDCNTTQDPLPDGIYVIKYSISPNDLVYVEYNHLRITKALEVYKKLLCDLDLASCESSVEKSRKLAELIKYKGYLESAKAKVELCHESKKGMDLYNYALKKMRELGCITC